MKKIVLCIAMATMVASASAYAGDQPQEDQARTQKSGRIGCIAGGVLGGVLGNKLFKDNKAVGTAAGAGLGCAGGNFLGKKWSKARQLKEFEEAQAQAQAAGMHAEVTSKATTEDGKPSQELDAMVIGYNSADMSPVTPKTAAVFDKIASISNRSKVQLTFTFQGTTHCDVPLNELVKRGALNGAGVQHTVDVQCGKGEGKIIISPIPEVK